MNKIYLQTHKVDLWELPSSEGEGKIFTHLTLRTRIKQLARKTICFSKSTLLHDIVIGLFINRYEFGRAV